MGIPKHTIQKLIYKGFKDMFSFYKGVRKKGPKEKRPSKSELYQVELVKATAKGAVKKSMWGIYHHFKKHHGMLNW